MESSPYLSLHTFLTSAEISVSPLCTLTPIPRMGTGLVAVADIPPHTELFSVPKTAVLTTKTCGLKELLPKEEWEGLNGGWGRLILCLMYEQGRGEGSPWKGYLDILPTNFDTPMFWSEVELSELKGTSIFDKIGLAEATNEYTTRLLPIIQAHPEVFPPAMFDSCFSLEWFHTQGSRILSRSFGVEGVKDEDDSDDDELEDEEGDGGEDVDKVGMVPMADMLNARWGEENARLFYTETHLSMITTQPIASGAQIYNTYAHPPNSDLLRRYGHTDVIPPSLVGNEEDEVELRCDTLVAVAEELLEKKAASTEGAPAWDKKAWDMEGRVEFWLEEGGDDIIPLQITFPLPPPLLAFLTLLVLPTATYESAKSKGKLPRPKITLEGVEVGRKVLGMRLAEYPTILENDLQLLASPSLPERLNAAIVVRAGEKNVLHECLKLLEVEETRLKAEEAAGGPPEKKSSGSSKRKNVGGAGAGGSRKKIR
ncbi:hypothetical protein BDY24DRAFT_417352 [Mrakia frigida]|uniref:ribosomal lysine N-methyltransferase n=1 Tax=Mrakia frigida TaxID=29902 RepID=UPI003FCC21EE